MGDEFRFTDSHFYYNNGEGRGRKAAAKVQGLGSPWAILTLASSFLFFIKKQSSKVIKHGCHGYQEYTTNSVPRNGISSCIVRKAFWDGESSWGAKHKARRSRFTQKPWEQISFSSRLTTETRVLILCSVKSYTCQPKLNEVGQCRQTGRPPKWTDSFKVKIKRHAELCAQNELICGFKNKVYM